MSKAISYALFDAGNQPNCFDHNSFIRGFVLNVRLAKLLYPGWEVVLHVDKAIKSKYPILQDLSQDNLIRLVICEEAPLTKAMLWRMKPIFEVVNDEARYEHVLCRDADSPLSYKERLCVQEWMNNGKAAHAITDSVSHDMPMMGGMIGFVSKYFRERTGYESWDQMVKADCPYEVKGTDQVLLSNNIYPAFGRKGSESITQHYLQGYGQTWLSDWHDRVPEIEIPDVPSEMREAWCAPHQGICGHIGAAGHYTPALENFLRKYQDRFKDIRQHELKYPDIFYWVKTGEL